MSGNALSSARRDSDWIKKGFFSESEVLQWHRQPREVVQSLVSLGMFKNRVDVALKDSIVGNSDGKWMVALGDLGHLFQFW